MLKNLIFQLMIRKTKDKMAKTSAQKNLKRIKLVKKYAKKRAALKDKTIKIRTFWEIWLN